MLDCERCTADRCAECVDGSEWREYREGDPMEKDVTVYEVPAGHGRFHSFRADGGGAIIYHFYAEDAAEPGGDITPEHFEATHKQWIPVFGIKLTRSGSARAWSVALRHLAEAMEAEEQAKTITEV